MRVKIFSATRREYLEEQVNHWLETHMVNPDMRFQYQQGVIDDEGGYILEHTLILFYVPRHGEQ